MSTELIAILAVGVGLISTSIALTGLMLVQISQSERRSIERTNRLESEMSRRFDKVEADAKELEARIEREIGQLRTEVSQQIGQLRTEMNQQYGSLRDEMNQQYGSLRDEMNRQYGSLRAEMNRRFDEQDVRIRGLEQGQSYLSGQFSALKDYFTHASDSGNAPENVG